jgi:carbon storage regulator
MLILGRKPGDAIHIGENIRLVVLACDRGSVRLGIDAPDDVKIMRGEIVRDIAAENQRAGASGDAAQQWVRLIGGPTRDET